MNTLTYKGYTAKIEFDERDDIFVGRILGIDDIITFHADNVADMKSEFAYRLMNTLHLVSVLVKNHKNLPVVV
ncbi:MAG: hypothetical protein IJR44_02865 [Neisseriaceae bacterium]|nr:hypothetical protein [Neisseriaceae bacterium]